MKIGIIGAGFTGLSAAYTLAKEHHTIMVFERDPQPGGLAIGYQEKNWDWTLEKHYHHWFTNDKSVLSLAQEIEYPVLIKRPHTNWYVNRNIYEFDSISAALRFPPLNLVERLRALAVLGFFKTNPVWQPLETVNASTFLPKVMGRHAYEVLFEPLFLNKFGEYANDVSLAWFWARVVKRTPSLAYPEKGFLPFAQTLVEKINEQKTAHVHFNQEIVSLESKGKPVLTTKSVQKTKPEKHEFDRVIVTLPGGLFVKIAPSLPKDYQTSLTSLKSLGATNLILRLSHPFFRDNTYWLSVADKNSPIMAIVEHTNFMDKKHYGNEHLVYLGNYLSPSDKRFSMTDEQTLKLYKPFLKTINPEFLKNLIGYKLFKAPFAQPIIPPNYSKILPPFETPLPNVFLANIQQVYPWDRGTNYAVELGEKIATKVQNSE